TRHAAGGWHGPGDRPPLHDVAGTGKHPRRDSLSAVEAEVILEFIPDRGHPAPAPAVFTFFRCRGQAEAGRNPKRGANSARTGWPRQGRPHIFTGDMKTLNRPGSLAPVRWPVRAAMIRAASQGHGNL